MDADDRKNMIVAMAVSLVIIVGWTYYTGQFKPSPADQTPTSAPQPAPAPTAQPVAQPAATVTPGTAAATPAPMTGQWQVQLPPPATEPVRLGSHIADDRDFKAELIVDPQTGGLRQVLLSEHKFLVDDEETGYPLLNECWTVDDQLYHSFTFGKLQLANTPLPLNLARGCWQVNPITTDETTGQQDCRLKATILDPTGNPALEIIKTYSIVPGSYNVKLNVQLINLTQQPIVPQSLEFTGPMGLTREDRRGDRRRTVAAYRSRDGKLNNESVQLTKLEKDPGAGRIERPNAAMSFEWFATANKFFSAIVTLAHEQGQGQFAKFQNATVTAEHLTTNLEDAPFDETIGTRGTLVMERALQPGETAAFDLSVYMGPIDNDIFEQPPYKGLGYDSLIHSRSCFCTIKPLTLVILKIMNVGYRTIGNYGIAIMILVLFVRLLLHPITKRSQISMMGMSKLGPQVEEIKQKYANDQKEMQRQIAMVYKEHGATPIWGCLPMLIQMPIWISLYTAVDTNVGMRHKGLLPASWHWLTDLTAPDRLIHFEWFNLDPINVPMLGAIDAFNLLPILLCIAIYLQTKLNPQSQMAGSTNPQAAEQQKMMMFMMPIMMLVFLYNAPSGLNLYIMSSTFAGVIEQKRIRKHLQEIKEKEQDGQISIPKKSAKRFAPKKNKPKPPQRYI